jgi:ribosomal protein S4
MKINIYFVCCLLLLLKALEFISYQFFLFKQFRVGKNIATVPSLLVRTDAENVIDWAAQSPLGGGRPGRTKRKNMKREKKPAEE